MSYLPFLRLGCGLGCGSNPDILSRRGGGLLFWVIVYRYCLFNSALLEEEGSDYEDWILGLAPPPEAPRRCHESPRKKIPHSAPPSKSSTKESISTPSVKMPSPCKAKSASTFPSTAVTVPSQTNSNQNSPSSVKVSTLNHSVKTNSVSSFSEEELSGLDRS